MSHLTPQEAQRKAKAGALILDVRTPLERKASHIPGSRALVLSDLTSQWETLPKDREIICQCSSGQRSAVATRFLNSKGLKAYNLAGGIDAWRRSGLLLE